MAGKIRSSFIKKVSLLNGEIDTLEQLNKFRVGPFVKKNEALTVMQALRRTLLSNARGTGIFGVHIPKVLHEFSTIPGVKEDTVELTLNLQTLVFKGYSSTPIILDLEFEGPGVVTANNLNHIPPEICCLNSSQYIATVENKTFFKIQVLISNQPVPLPTNFLPVNTVPAPIKAVNFCIESEGKEESDFCILEIRTNGSISPLDAVREALKRISFLFCLIEISFIPDSNFQAVPEKLRQTKKRKERAPIALRDNNYSSSSLKNAPIEKLLLSTRTTNCLRRHNIYTIHELMTYNEEQLLNLEHFGKKSSLEVAEKLREFHGRT